MTWPWTDDDLHGNFRIAPGDTLATIVADYVEECANSRRAVADADLDDPARGEGMDFTLRFAMLHMIEDMGKDPSNPIINTDYRFSLGKLKYYRVLSVGGPSAAGSRRSPPLACT